MSARKQSSLRSEVVVYEASDPCNCRAGSGGILFDFPAQHRDGYWPFTHEYQTRVVTDIASSEGTGLVAAAHIGWEISRQTAAQLLPLERFQDGCAAILARALAAENLSIQACDIARACDIPSRSYQAHRGKDALVVVKDFADALVVFEQVFQRKVVQITRDRV